MKRKNIIILLGIFTVFSVFSVGYYYTQAKLYDLKDKKSSVSLSKGAVQLEMDDTNSKWKYIGNYEKLSSGLVDKIDYNNLPNVNTSGHSFPSVNLDLERQDGSKLFYQQDKTSFFTDNENKGFANLVVGDTFYLSIPVYNTGTVEGSFSLKVVEPDNDIWKNIINNFDYQVEYYAPYGNKSGILLSSDSQTIPTHPENVKILFGNTSDTNNKIQIIYKFRLKSGDNAQNFAYQVSDLPIVDISIKNYLYKVGGK